MGVPKFYRWISERYPCLSEIIKEYQIPDFDNLYLDMNGIIHTCSHPNDDDPHFRISEEKIFAGICHYIDFLFKTIRPKKVFFMAIDGVAPRAKMNQQRGRRFRAAKSALVCEERAKALGENLPSEARFDSNCITPGTEFMARLHSILKEFVIHKISSHKLWKNVRIYLSGHEAPGEGEHKIMDFIRYEKAQPDYNSNTRHCLYGLDADLIMLSLCSHEIYFSLLREEVKFGGKKAQRRLLSPEETTFHLLHISLLRDYLYHEFSPVKSKMSFEFDLECIIDDFVLMSFLVGNDFIPHLPQLHIHHDALPVLFRTYMDVLPSLTGYINEQGTLNLSRFEIFLLKLSEYDFKKIRELNDGLQYLSDKSKSKDNTSNSDNSNTNDKNRKNISDFLSGLGLCSMAISEMAIFDSSPAMNDDDDSSEECDSLELELFNMHKIDYYLNKLEFSKVTPEILKDQAEGYVRAIQWNLHYYYNGVVSWSWYYPYRYSPCISDIRDFKNMEMKFELGKPFLPFQQLLAVLPKLSKDLLPKPYQKLMCATDSPLIDFYPDDFETDLNGKQQEWEAIVLIPFINEKLLLKCAEMADKELTVDEKNRNSHGPHLLYTYSAKSLGKQSSFLPGYYPALNDIHFKVQTIDPDFFRLPSHHITKGLARGVAITDRIILGFPTLKVVSHTAELRNENVKVFQMISQKENMVLTIKEHTTANLQKVAHEILGKVICVDWPHLREAFVLAVSDGRYKILYEKSESAPNKNVFMQTEMSADEIDICNKQIESIKEHNYRRWGIFVGNVDILVHAKCLSGTKMVWIKEGKLKEEKQWDGPLCSFALQTTVSEIDVFHPDSNNDNSLDIFSIGSVVFVLVQPYYGSTGTIEFENRNNTFLVNVEIVSEPDLMPLIQNKDKFISEEYMPCYVAAQQLGLESNFVSRLMGTILLQTNPRGSSNPNHVNVGLNLKSNLRNEEILGFTRKVENVWLYSKKAVGLLNAYLSTFPYFFDHLFKYVRKDVIYLEDLYPNEEGNKLIHEITKWLKSQESASAERQTCGITRLDPGIVHEIEKIVSHSQCNPTYVKRSYSPHHLYSPFMCKGLTKPDPATHFNLFDRVINVSYSSCVPLGLRGTIIGKILEVNESDVMYEIVFDKEFFGGLTLGCSIGKGYRLSSRSLINISHSLRGGQKFFYQFPTRTAKGNIKATVAETLIKKLQFLHRKEPQVTSAASIPFCNVNEMFQIPIPNASPQNSVFSQGFTEAANKQFAIPEVGYVTGNVPERVLAKKNTPSLSKAIYKDLWIDLKKGKPESSSNVQNNQYGQKLAVKE